MSKVKLGNHIKSYAGGTPSRGNMDYYRNGTIPWVKSGEVCRKYITSVEEKITEEAVQGSSAKWFPENSVLVALYGATAGQVSITKIKGTSNQAVLSVNGLDDFDNEYLYYLLTHSTPELLVKVQGSGQPNLSKKIIDELQVELKELAEQKKIAEILTSVDKVIELTEIEIEKLKNLKKGMMQDLLTKGIRHTKFKDTPIGKIPESWECSQIKDLIKNGFIEKVQDGNHGGAYPRVSDFTEKGIPFVSAKNLHEHGYVKFNECPKLPESYLPKLRIGFGKPGDVIFAHNATVGPTAYVPNSGQDFIVSTSTTLYRSNSEKLDNYYLYASLLSPLFQTQISKVMGQTTRNQVPITAQKEMYLTVPPLNEQNEINNAVKAILGTLISKEEKLQKLVSLKKGLMQDLLTGKVRVKV
ncbi:putative type I restriction enzyme specificity protein [Halobacteriovorax marinus SJ]|uniref:Type I restriction enzyme specificity protein n=1 Tax=Halobacteriovorax marinus (strain ATCC BAA-682 / DSM 15412 / SJ) TaxID=862908 RepID=E1X5X4_HALMS|nr:restriction endonuclease subunit S [Halobacteriovorax marinus]CBW25691.1 putative type I restriction enzyme specificity protein [Halobacteriovorax marinus SJ]